ncbi:MAG: glutathione S-transferase family protein [Pseudomonadota bacterium]
MLTLWGRSTSVNVQKPMWLLAELGLAYERKDVGGPFGGLDDPAFRALSPAGLIPALLDERAGRRAAVFESAAILRYLAAIERAEAFWPSDPQARAQVDSYAEWAQAAVYPPLTALFLGIVRTPVPDRDAGALKAALETLLARLVVAERRLSAQEWLAGASPGATLADIVFGAALHRILTLEITRPETPALEAYYSRLKDRPAYRSVIAVDYDAMRVSGAERAAAPVV